MQSLKDRQLIVTGRKFWAQECLWTKRKIFEHGMGVSMISYNS